MNTTSKTIFSILAVAAALLARPAAKAQSISFIVDINTAGLSADSANSPFDLDFQMLYGNSALASNTATLSNFVLTGGTAVGSAVTSGSASGSIGSTVTLTASSAHTDSELYQQFSSGVTNIQFTATVTETGPDVGTPTEFAAALFDNSTGSPAPLYTTAPDTESLLTLNLNASNTLADIGRYAAVSSADGNTELSNIALTVIPEPPATAAILGFFCLAAALGARRLGLAGAA